MNYLLSLLAFLIFVLVALFVSDAMAQQEVCFPWMEMKQKLAAVGEAEVGTGLVNGNVILFLFRNVDGGTWSIVSLLTDGKACLVTSGLGWTDIPGDFPLSKGERAS